MKLNEKYKGCLYCSPNPKDRVSIVENSSDFLAIENDGTVAFGDDGAVTCYDRLLNFCPMCGRDLRSDEQFHQTYQEEESNGESIDKSPTSGD